MGDGHSGAHGAPPPRMDVRHDPDGAALGSRAAAQGSEQALRPGVDGICVNHRSLCLIFDLNQSIPSLFHRSHFVCSHPLRGRE